MKKLLVIIMVIALSGVAYAQDAQTEINNLTQAILRLQGQLQMLDSIHQSNTDLYVDRKREVQKQINDAANQINAIKRELAKEVKDEGNKKPD